MARKPAKRAPTEDMNQIAYRIAQEVIRRSEEQPPRVVPIGTGRPAVTGKNPAAVELGRLGGLKGGKARAERLGAERRRQIASNAARARWSQEKPKSPTKP